MHVPLDQALYSPNVFGDAALINYANLCKFVGLCVCQSVNILVYTFLTFWYTLFFIGLCLFNTAATDRVYFWHACTLGQGITLCLHDRLSVCLSVRQHFGIHFFNILVDTFLSVYIF